MLQRMSHRGPDGKGSCSFEGGAAGMVRLALVDLSGRGQQPLWSANRKVAILFNGEIYNFREQRNRLVEKGCQFQSKTDSEVILALFLEYGKDFVDHLRGMYTIALFDWRRTKPGGAPELLLARDPLGVKPLYIAATGANGAGCVFASELRALLASGLCEPRIDPISLRNYLRFGFTLQPRSIFASIRMLEPGVLEHYVPGKPMQRLRFWQMPPYEPRNETFAEAAERLRSVLDESIGLHAFADAKVGAFLSGGIDSTGIVGLMRKHIPHLKTYTLRYPEFPGWDESDEAQASAQRFDCENTIVDITGSDVRQSIAKFASDLDQPSSDGLNTWMVSRAAGRDVKGVLSGLGGDEWFAGYPCARRMLFYGTTFRGRLTMALGKLAGGVDAIVPNRGFEDSFETRIGNLAARRSLIAAWVHTHTVFTPRQVQMLLGDASAEDDLEPFGVMLRDHGIANRAETPIGLCGKLDVDGYMRCQLLRDSDATSMAHSLELRVPFVDIELAQFARTCKDEYKVDLRVSRQDPSGTAGAKRVLVQALRDVLPANTQDRPKRGFAMPIKHWLENELRDIVEDACSRKSVENRGLLLGDGVNALLNASKKLDSLLYPRVWLLTILELWCRSVLDECRRDPVESDAKRSRPEPLVDEHDRTGDQMIGAADHGQESLPH
jgi:asparagine synthase (glutamine-hydrolysing)